MVKKTGSRFSEDIEELFSSGTVILFTCATTPGFPSQLAKMLKTF